MQPWLPCLAGLALALAPCTAQITGSAAGASSQADPEANLPELRAGDVLLIQSGGELMEAVEEATGSRWTHCGMVLAGADGELRVVEAVGPVRWSTLEEFVEHAQSPEVLVLRPRQAPNEVTLTRMTHVAESMMDRPYDFAFRWDDDCLYCSELVWKLWYEGAGIELVPLSRLRDFRLDGPRASRMLDILHPDGVPLDEPVVAPASLTASRYLEPVAGE